MGALVEGLLLFGRAGVAPLEGEQAYVRATVGDVVEASQPAARDRGITVAVDDLCATTVACGPGVLTSMLSNLVENAVRYMGEEPLKRVSIGATTDGWTTRIEVRDTGPGVPPALRGKVFDPHVWPPGPSAPGLGLGLATVRRLAEAHGGKVGVARNLPKGSVFWFELPNVSRLAAPQGAAPRAKDRIRAWLPQRMLARLRSQGHG